MKRKEPMNRVVAPRGLLVARALEKLLAIVALTVALLVWTAGENIKSQRRGKKSREGCGGW